MSLSLCGSRPSRRFGACPVRTRVRLRASQGAPRGLPMSLSMCGSRPSRRLGACPVRTRVQLRASQRAPRGLLVSLSLCGGRPGCRIRAGPVRTQVLRRPSLPLVGGDCCFATIRAAVFQGYRKQSSLVTQPAASSRNTAAQGSAGYLGVGRDRRSVLPVESLPPGARRGVPGLR